jgi:hypothetical protein
MRVALTWELNDLPSEILLFGEIMAIKLGTDIDTMVVPRFRGTTDECLRKACIWVSGNCPGRRLTLEEIGRIMGVTRERVRQIEARALRKLRHPSRMNILNELRS